MKSWLRLQDSGRVQLGPRERFIAGSSAGIISQTSVYPMEVCVKFIDRFIHVLYCHLVYQD